MQNNGHWTEQTVGGYRLVDGRLQHAEHWPLDGTDSWGLQASGRKGTACRTMATGRNRQVETTG
jgi:hypothetical protein